MDYEVILSNRALSDLERIVTYITDDLGNPVAADAFLDRFDQMIDRLSESPLIFSLCISPYLAMMKLRKVSVGRYILLYQVDEEDHAVHIVHVASELEDYQHKL